ncbi:hypothetical protein BDV28DRAFT_42586 [Aspergillus coremiiformis]|uniref:Uncharacterized protein n=1 Tax=Aspergillus coremiiformis TaxID=138285 RepID=A0A5N6ZCS0_9EURO|nr:hypothetical protein BDV28DRAFT_42586 [Aspergillus coremiiformis]
MKLQQCDGASMKESQNMLLGDLTQALSRIHSYEEIRLFIAGTPNFGHQASSVNLLLRLAWDYTYPGLITVVYDPGDQTGGRTAPKLLRLLQRYVDPNAPEALPSRLHLAQLQWVSMEEFAARTSIRVGFGLTGGAEMERIYHSSLADMLNVCIALKLQPFQWPWCRDGIDFHSQSQRPTVDLLSDHYLGWRLFHRAYRLPRILYSPLPHDRQSNPDAIIKRLLALRSQTSRMSLSCVYGVRRQGVCHVDPANLLYIYFLALLEAFLPVTKKGGSNIPRRRILVVNFDEFWDEAFTRLQDYLYNHDSESASTHPSSTDQRPVALPTSEDLSNWVCCIRAPEELPAALNWFEEPQPQLQDTSVRGATYDNSHTPNPQRNDVKLLYIHIGFVAPESFVDALKQADLPIIFEGQQTASAVASMGKPYFKLRDSMINSPSQVLRIPDDTYRHSDAIDRVQAASLNLQLGALGEMDLEKSVECVANLITECTDSSSALKTYLNDLEAHYRKRGADKFETCLATWNRYGFLNQSGCMEGAHVEAPPLGSDKPVLHIDEARKILSQLGL